MLGENLKYIILEKGLIRRKRIPTGAQRTSKPSWIGSRPTRREKNAPPSLYIPAKRAKRGGEEQKRMERENTRKRRAEKREDIRAYGTVLEE